MFLFAPAGVLLIGLAMATTEGYSDARILYCWPILWAASFYGSRETASVVALVAVVHAAALCRCQGTPRASTAGPTSSSPVIVAGVVARVLARRNRRLVHQLSTEARVDPLTGLWNRRAFAERLETESARAVREGTSLAVVAFDIDQRRTRARSRRPRAKWVTEVLAHETRGANITRASAARSSWSCWGGGAQEFAERVRGAVAAGGGPADGAVTE